MESQLPPKRAPSGLGEAGTVGAAGAVWAAASGVADSGTAAGVAAGAAGAGVVAGVAGVAAGVGAAPGGANILGTKKQSLNAQRLLRSLRSQNQNHA